MPTVDAGAVNHEEYLERVRASLAEQLGPVDQRRFEGGLLTIARRSDFRWRWGGVRLTTTMAIAGFRTDVDVATLDRFLAAAVREASRKDAVRGLGLQRGAAAIAVAVFDVAPPTALEWAGAAHGHRFAVAGYPVVVDASTGTVTQPRTMRMGRLFRGHLRALTNRTLVVSR